MAHYIHFALTIFSIWGLTTGVLSASPEPKSSDQNPSFTPHTPAADLRGDWAAEVDPDLPNVLIIGDSISIGYTRLVRAHLKDHANVFRPMMKNGRRPINCGDTSRGLENLDQWLGDRQWDLIHFNWGLWDLCYRHPESKEQGHRDKIHGTQLTTPDDYRKNLTKLVKKLQATNATLVWAHTTVVPEGEAGRYVGDDIKYNQIAAEIMTQHDIAINDLHAITKAFPPEQFVKPGDVHYTPDGYAKIAEHVARFITKQLDDTSRP